MLYKLKIFISEKQAHYCQEYQLLGLTIMGIFGGSSKEGSQKNNKIDYTNPVVTSPEQLNAFLANRGKR